MTFSWPLCYLFYNMMGQSPQVGSEAYVVPTRLTWNNPTLYSLHFGLWGGLLNKYDQNFIAEILIHRQIWFFGKQEKQWRKGEGDREMTGKVRGSKELK